MTKQEFAPERTMTDETATARRQERKEPAVVWPSAATSGGGAYIPSHSHAADKAGAA